MVTRFRKTSRAVLLLLFVLLPVTASAAEDSGTILRIRGGFAYDPDHDPGSGWLAGGGIGHSVGRSLLLSLNYDHIHMSGQGPVMSIVRPVTVQVELGMPWKRGIRPRLGAGAGFYLRKSVATSGARTLLALSTSGNARGAFVYPAEYMRRSSHPFGMNVVGGLSAPLSGSTLLDIDIRFHQTMDRAAVIGIADVGISYMWH